VCPEQGGGGGSGGRPGRFPAQAGPPAARGARQAAGPGRQRGRRCRVTQAACSLFAGDLRVTCGICSSSTGVLGSATEVPETGRAAAGAGQC